MYSQLAVMPGSARATAAQLHYSGNLTIKARVNIRSTDKLEQSQKRICLEYQDNTDVLTALLSSCSPKEQQIMQSSQAKQTSRFFYIALFFHLTVASQFCSKLFLPQFKITADIGLTKGVTLSLLGLACPSACWPCASSSARLASMGVMGRAGGVSTLPTSDSL